MSATVMPEFETPAFTIHDDDVFQHESSTLFSKKVVVPASTATITPLHTSTSTTHSFSSSNTPIISPSSLHPAPSVAVETDIDDDIDSPNTNDRSDDFDEGEPQQRKRSDSQQTPDDKSPPAQQDSKPKTRRPRKLSSSSASNRRTVAILDWDDTLLPSSWLRKQGHLQSFAYALHQYQQQLQQRQQQLQQQQSEQSTSVSSTSSSPSLPTLPTLPTEIAAHLTSLSSAVVSLVRNLMDPNNLGDSKQSRHDGDDDDDDDDEEEDDPVSRVVIVTNAEQGWVELTARSFLPELLPYLDIASTTNSSTSTTLAPPSTPSPSSTSSTSSSSRNRQTQKKITIISARSSFEQQFPGAPLTWKMRAFEKVLGEAINAFNAETTQLNEQGVLTASTSRVLNVLSIGDSIIEREAARRVVACTSSTNSVVLCKSVKLAERTSCEKLCRQLQLMTHALNYVRSHTESLDLQMTITDDTEGKLPPTASMQKATPPTTSTDNNSTTSPTSTTPSKSLRHHKSKEIEEIEPPKKAKWWRRVLACGVPVYD